jgi:hypothetical protein
MPACWVPADCYAAFVTQLLDKHDQLLRASKADEEDEGEDAGMGKGSPTWSGRQQPEGQRMRARL